MVKFFVLASSQFDFLDVATDLELAEFYEENWERILVFLFESYLLMISKIWVLESSSHRNCAIFAFGRELAAPEVFSEAGEPPVVEDALIKQVRLVCDRIQPVDSEARDKWASALKRESNPAVYLKFPIVFARLLQLVPAARILGSSVSELLVCLITRLLHAKNMPVLRVEGLKMLLTWLKASSYSGDGERAAENCIRLFNSLVAIESLGSHRNETNFEGDDLLSNSSSILMHGPALLSVAGVSQNDPVDAETAFREHLSMLNEILAFITWDVNPDLHSTRFLWTLLRDHYLASLFPHAYASSSKLALRRGDRIGQCQFDSNLRSEVLELLVDYLSLWLIKNTADRSSYANNTGNTQTSASGSASMINLAVNDLSNLFIGLGRSESYSFMLSNPSLSKSHQEFPVSSFLLEEIILQCPEDVRFVHLILRSACVCLPFVGGIFSIKLVMEILRTWVFNPPARRPAFLQNADDAKLDEYVEFYLECLYGLFPGEHLEPSKAESPTAEARLTMVDRLDIYKEAVFFIRALALQAFIPLCEERWLQLLDLILEISEFLLSPDNDLERPFLSNEDALLCETILGCLMRAGLPEKHDLKFLERWREASRVLMLCAGCDGVIEEWCRVTETLAILLLKDPRFGANSAVSRTVSVIASPKVTSPIVSPNVSAMALPSATSSFAAWPELPNVKTKSLAFFRNILRILGDPSKLPSLHCKPDLICKIYESFERISAAFLRARSNQNVKTSSSALPPLADLLPPLLSGVLNSHQQNGAVDVHITTRSICWRVLGRILFRPADFAVPDHFWGTLLLAARNWLNQGALNASELAAFMQYIALPISNASVPGCTVIMTDIVDALLRFFNDALWSGQVKFTAVEAGFLLPASLKFVSNAWSLALIHPSAFGHFRDSSCLLRLLKLLAHSITDSDLLGLIYATVAASFVNEFTVPDNHEFSQGLFEMILEALSLQRGVKPALAVADYISALAFFPATFTDSFAEKLILAMMEACIHSLPQHEAVVVDLTQGALSDWLLFRLRSRFPSEACQVAFMKLISAVDHDSDNWKKAPSASASLLTLSQRMLIYKQSFPGPAGPSLIGSPPSENRKLLLSLALTPASTILSFEVDGAGVEEVVYLTSRSSFGRFTWRFGRQVDSPPPPAIKSPPPQRKGSKSKPRQVSKFKVLPDDEFPLPLPKETSGPQELETDIPQQEQSPHDVLRRTMNYLAQKYPENDFKSTFFLLQDSISNAYKRQLAKEAEFVERTVIPQVIPNVISTPAERPLQNPQTKSTLTRSLLTSLGLTLPDLYTSQPGFGIELLKDGHERELEALDSLAARKQIKIGCLYVPPGVTEEREILPFDGPIEQSYSDFMNSLAKSLSDECAHFGYRGGVVDGEAPLCYLGTPTFELVTHQNLGHSEDSTQYKRHLGNDSVLIIWHASPDTLNDRNIIRSEMTSAIIRIQPHALLPGWFQVSLQTCFERVIQPRKFARLRADAFAVMAEGGFPSSGFGESEKPGGGVFSLDRVQSGGLLVPLSSLGAIVRALAITASQETYWLEGNRSKSVAGKPGEQPTTITVTPADRVRLAPESLRKERIDSIIASFGEHDLPYDRFLSRLFY